jgi:hypothetical protein
VIECETTGDWLWEPFYEQLGQMDKYSRRTQHFGIRAARSPLLFYIILIV